MATFLSLEDGVLALYYCNEALALIIIIIIIIVIYYCKEHILMRIFDTDESYRIPYLFFKPETDRLFDEDTSNMKFALENRLHWKI